jgi:hypothetical protein
VKELGVFISKLYPFDFSSLLPIDPLVLKKRDDMGL